MTDKPKVVKQLANIEQFDMTEDYAKTMQSDPEEMCPAISQVLQDLIMAWAREHANIHDNVRELAVQCLMQCTVNMAAATGGDDKQINSMIDVIMNEVSLRHGEVLQRMATQDPDEIVFLNPHDRSVQ